MTEIPISSSIVSVRQTPYPLSPPVASIGNCTKTVMKAMNEQEKREKKEMKFFR